VGLEKMNNTRPSQNALRDAGLHFGIIGALAFVVFILIFREDWTDRFRYLSVLLPLPVISLLVARRFTLPGGLLLIGSGVGAAMFDFFFSPAHPGQITGRGLGYTWIFVTLPLAISGVLYLILWWKSR
jgi:hypothetical protein